MAFHGHHRRTRRDWIVDTALFLAALGYGFGWALYLQSLPQVSGWHLALDQVLGLAACLLLWLRRRRPMLVAAMIIPMSAYGDLADGAMVVALFTVAIHCRARTTAVVAAANLLVLGGYIWIRSLIDPPQHGDLSGWLGYTLVLHAASIGWGLFIRKRRQLVLSLEERAERAERVARLQAAQAQHLAREEIAREMHDVLGHRLSLLSVHAGALAYRDRAADPETAESVRVIRDSAHQALQDLREVIGVLRSPLGELPQPTLDDVGELITESRRAGMRIADVIDVVGDPPGGIGRTAYRVVQEGLTNVRKHAEGEPQVEVRLMGRPGAELRVCVIDHSARPRPAEEDDPVGGEDQTGQGLAGLRERVQLASGTFESGPTNDGGFRVSARLPFPNEGGAR
ncbi:MAG: sensor histidine kinase [Propionibacteriaceae bacterium]